jgi:hypothetical protein
VGTTKFDALTRSASRRVSLLALGGAGLAAALAGAFGAAAKPKPGKLARKKVKEKCKAQVRQCNLVLGVACDANDDPAACKEAFLPCCDFLATCNVAQCSSVNSPAAFSGGDEFEVAPRGAA